MKELTVVKDENSKVNLTYLENAQKPQENKNGSSKVQIDKLRVKVGKVVYKDYSKRKNPAVMKFNIDNEVTCEEVKDPNRVFELAIASALAQSDIGYLADFNLIPFIKNMHTSCRKPTILATKIINKTIEFSKDLCDATGHAFKTSTEKIKNYFSPKKENLANNP